MQHICTDYDIKCILFVILLQIAFVNIKYLIFDKVIITEHLFSFIEEKCRNISEMILYILAAQVCDQITTRTAHPCTRFQNSYRDIAFFL